MQNAINWLFPIIAIGIVLTCLYVVWRRNKSTEQSGSGSKPTLLDDMRDVALLNNRAKGYRVSEERERAREEATSLQPLYPARLGEGEILRQFGSTFARALGESLGPNYLQLGTPWITRGAGLSNIGLLLRHRPSNREGYFKVYVPSEDWRRMLEGHTDMAERLANNMADEVRASFLHNQPRRPASDCPAPALVRASSSARPSGYDSAGISNPALLALATATVIPTRCDAPPTQVRTVDEVAATEVSRTSVYSSPAASYGSDLGSSSSYSCSDSGSSSSSYSGGE